MMAFVCKSCGASFESRSDLAKHQHEERQLEAAATDISAKLAADDSPSMGNADNGDVARIVDIPVNPYIKDGRLIIPHAYLDKRIRYVSSTTPIFVEAKGYRCPEGLAVKPNAFKLRMVKAR